MRIEDWLKIRKGELIRGGVIEGPTITTPELVGLQRIGPNKYSRKGSDDRMDESKVFPHSFISQLDELVAGGYSIEIVYKGKDFMPPHGWTVGVGKAGQKRCPTCGVVSAFKRIDEKVENFGSISAAGLHSAMCELMARVRIEEEK